MLLPRRQLISLMIHFTKNILKALQKNILFLSEEGSFVLDLYDKFVEDG